MFNLDIIILVIVFKTDIDTFSCFKRVFSLSLKIIFMFKLDILFNVCIFKMIFIFLLIYF